MQPGRDDPIRTGDLAPPRRRMKGEGKRIALRRKGRARARSKIVIDGIVWHRAKTRLEGYE